MNTQIHGEFRSCSPIEPDILQVIFTFLYPSLYLQRLLDLLEVIGVLKERIPWNKAQDWVKYDYVSNWTCDKRLHEQNLRTDVNIPGNGRFECVQGTVKGGAFYPKRVTDYSDFPFVMSVVFQWELHYYPSTEDEEWLMQHIESTDSLKEEGKCKGVLTKGEKLIEKVGKKEESKKIKTDKKEKLEKIIIEEKVKGKGDEKEVVDYPSDYCCPISQQIMIDPARLVEKPHCTYEFEEITNWLKEHDTNPLDNTVLKSKALVPNKELKLEIMGFLKKNPQFWDEVYSSKALRSDLRKAIESGNVYGVGKCLEVDPHLAQDDELFELASKQKKTPEMLKAFTTAIESLSIQPEVKSDKSEVKPEVVNENLIIQPIFQGNKSILFKPAPISQGTLMDPNNYKIVNYQNLNI